MFEQIKTIINKLAPDMWVYILIGLIGLVFLTGLIIALLFGDANKFKKAAKKFLKNPNGKTAVECAEKMPVKVKKLYKRAKKAPGKPSDIIGFDACVAAPYSTSFAAKFTKTVLYTSFFAVVLAFGIIMVNNVPTIDAETGESINAWAHYAVYIAIALTAAAGLIFTLLAGIVSTVIYNGTVKTFNAYVDKLDEIAKGGAETNTHDNDTVAMDTSMAQSEETIINSAPVMNEEQDMRFKTFEAPSKLNIEYADSSDDDNTIITETVTETIIESTSSAQAEREALEEEIRREKQEAAKKAAEKNAAFERAKAQAEERRKAMESRVSQNARMSEPVMVEPVMSMPGAAIIVEAPAAPAPSSNQTDEVIAKIEKINREGAPLATMKEVAMLLQQERAKPENKTPEQQKKLNEALSTLLKAMSSANKR